VSDVSAQEQDEQPFDLRGGALCLDFTNSVSDRAGEAPVERLRSYADLVAWARQAGVVDQDEAAALTLRSAERPAAAEQALAGAIDLREILFRLFVGVAAGEPPPPADLAALNERLPGALGHLRVAPEGDGFAWRWAEDPGALDPMLAPIVRSAADLLTGPDLAAVRECASGACRWLFLDRSRNRSRRWCDMKVCGNRAKARRHYRRRVAAGSG
jgi:predicted RNA-binding Zn ribbon-like protein